MKFTYKWKDFIVRVSRIHWWSLILCTCDWEDREYSKQKELVIIRWKLNYKKDIDKRIKLKDKARDRVYKRLDKNFYKIDDILKMNY